MDSKIDLLYNMKNIITISLTFLIWGNVYTQYTQVTDTVFEKYLIKRGWDDTLDGRISNSNVKDIKYLNIGDWGDFYGMTKQEILKIHPSFCEKFDHEKIKSLDGIKAFKSLEILRCWDQQLNYLDLSKNKNLRELSVGNFLNINACKSSQKIQIQILNLSSNSKLEVLELHDISIKKILLKNSQNLKTLDYSNNFDDTSSRNNIEDLHLTNLLNLNCSNNSITALDLISFKNLESLNCSNNSITNLNLSNCKNLESLNCSNNKIKSLDLSNCNNLESLDCSINEIKKLDLHNLKESCVSFSTNPVRKIIFKSQHCNTNVIWRIFSSKKIKEDNLLYLLQSGCYEELDFENFNRLKFTCR